MLACQSYLIPLPMLWLRFFSRVRLLSAAIELSSMITTTATLFTSQAKYSQADVVVSFDGSEALDECVAKVLEKNESLARLKKKNTHTHTHSRTQILLRKCRIVFDAREKGIFRRTVGFTMKKKLVSAAFELSKGTRTYPSHFP